jgi:hypothetical protein
MGKVVLIPLQKYVSPSPVYPCRNCVYMFVCGSSTRTEPCEGRITKTMKNRSRNFREVTDEANRRRQSSQ